MQFDCPEEKKDKREKKDRQEGKKKFRKPKNQAFAAWDADDSSESSQFKDEVAHVCFMAHEQKKKSVWSLKSFKKLSRSCIRNTKQLRKNSKITRNFKKKKVNLTRMKYPIY